MKCHLSALLLLAYSLLPTGRCLGLSDTCHLFGILFDKHPAQNLCIPSETSSVPSSYFSFDNIIMSQSVRKIVFDISIKSIGLDDPSEKFLGHVTVNGMNYYTYPSRGYTVVTLTPGVGILDRRVFDVFAGADTVQEMTNFLKGLKDGTIVLASVWDDGSANMNNHTYDLLKGLGAKQPLPLQLRASYALIGYKGEIQRDFVADLTNPREKGPAILGRSLTFYLPWLSISNNLLTCNYNSSVKEYNWYKDGMKLSNPANTKTYRLSGIGDAGFYQCSVDFESYQIMSALMDLRKTSTGGVTSGSNKTAYLAAIGVLAFVVVVLLVALAILYRKLRAGKGDAMYQSPGYTYSDRYEKVIPSEQQTPVPRRPKEPAQNASVPIAGDKCSPVYGAATDDKNERTYVVQDSRNSGYEVNSYDDSYLKMNNP